MLYRLGFDLLITYMRTYLNNDKSTLVTWINRNTDRKIIIKLTPPCNRATASINMGRFSHNPHAKAVNNLFRRLFRQQIQLVGHIQCLNLRHTASYPNTHTCVYRFASTDRLPPNSYPTTSDDSIVFVRPITPRFLETTSLSFFTVNR